jgi:hypothetical protein
MSTLSGHPPSTIHHPPSTIHHPPSTHHPGKQTLAGLWQIPAAGGEENEENEEEIRMKRQRFSGKNEEKWISKLLKSKV